MKLQFNHLKNINVIFLSVIMISLPLLSFIPISTASETTYIKIFGDGDSQKIIEFDSGPSWNKEAYFTIPNNQTVTEATFEIDGLGKQGSYPANLTLDVGNDGDTDWQFKGEGYGPLGRQKVFLNNQTTRTITFTQPFTTDTSTKLRLPKNAYIDQANMKVTGLPTPYPQTVTIDVEDQNIFTHSGELDTTYITLDFSNQLNNILTTASSATFTDSYNNSFLDINMSVYCGSTGKVKMHSLKIIYYYSSVVDLNNHNVNLAAELTEHIPHIEGGSINVVLAFKSDTVGKLWMKNVYIAYRNRDEPPNLKKNIPDLHVAEDTKEKKIDLSEYFYDDRVLDSKQLTYEILNHTETNVGLAIVDDTWLEIDAMLVPDWYGSFTEIIKVTDLVNNVRESNEFTIYIDSVNDEPVFNEKIQNITVDEDTTSDGIDLSAQDYFTDVENDILFYSMQVDPLGDYSGEAALSIDYNSETTVFTVIALSDWFGDDVPVWIYCDDDEEVNTLSHLKYVYQEIYVNVTPVNDGPYWLENIDDAHINEDEDIDNWINLEDYINDIDNTKDELSYGIFDESNPDNIKVTIDSDHNIDITTLTRDYIGSSTVTVEITDDGEQLLDTFDVIIDPVDDIPVVNITSHKDGAVINGTVTIHGTASDDKDRGVIFRVESQISNNTFIGSWEDTGGTYLWEYVWYTEEYSDGNYKFSVKAYDGALYSKAITYNFTLQNEGVIIDPDKKESEALAVNIIEPDNNSILQDEVVVKGNAAIIYGEGGITVIDNVYIQFIGEGSSPWVEATGTSNWEYTWNTQDVSNGDYEIVVMAVSGDFKSPLKTLNVEVDNPEDLPVDPNGNGNGNGNGITTIIDKTGDNFWLLLIFLLILFILAG